MKRSTSELLSNVLKIRKQKGYSQEYMASKLGMKQAGYALIEREERGLQYQLLLQIADILELDIVDIITYSEINNNKNKKTRILVEIELTDEELEEMRLKEKVLKSI